MLAIPLVMAGTGVVYLLNRMAGGSVVRSGGKPSPLPEPRKPVTPPVVRPHEPAPKPPVDDDDDGPELPAPGPNEGPVKPVDPPAPPPDEPEAEAELPTPPAPEPVTPTPGPVTPAPAPEEEPDGPLPPAPTPDDVESDEPPPGPPTPPEDEPEAEAELPTPPAPEPVTPTPGPVTPTPKPSGPPAGFSVTEIQRLAPIVAADLAKRAGNYARANMRLFQKAAGIDADGIYGGESWGALEHAMGGAVHKSLFVPTPKQAYVWAHLVPYGIGRTTTTKPVTPAPTPVTPTPAPSPSSPPAGFNVALAAKLAPGVAADIAAHEYDFARAKLRDFQQAAGIDTDGIYGGQSWGALEHFMGGAVHKALAKPVAKEAYAWAKLVPYGISKGSSSSAAVTPPPAPTPAPVVPTPPVDEGDDDEDAPTGPTPPPGYDRAKAKKMAPQVAANLQSKQRANYDRNLLKSFQLAAGIDADGIYGGESRGALQYFGARPPAAFFAPVAVKPYKWAEFDG